MMPPKKSKAARTAVHDQDEASKPEDDKKPEEKKPEEDAPAEEEEDGEDINIFKVEIVEGKRPRNLPAGWQNMQDWVTDHLEAKAEHEVVLIDAYETYVSSCVSTGAFALSQHEFMKAVKDKYPTGSSVKETSPYAGLIRVKKPKKEKTDKKERVQADSLKLKMKDIVMEALEEMGNPSKGVRFFMLKQHIAGKFPALMIESRPKKLLTFLERCVKFGQLELVRGVGMCGFYRQFGPSKSDDEADKENKEEKKEETEEDEKKTVDDKEKTDKEEGEEIKESTEEKTTEEGEVAEDKKEDEKKDDDDDDDGNKRKTRKRKPADKPKGKSKKKSKPTKKYRSFVIHSDPERIEDTFQMAMTYMVEPKEASARRILKYITDYYNRDMTTEKLRKCVEQGCEKGYWEQVTGQGFSGTFRLLMDEFDPTADDDLVGQITNALVACTEPKQCSANLLKSYLNEYHPQFEIAKKPHLFKKSLERAISKDIIRQLSGIGASGSFQLSEVFTPTPVILKGVDREDDYESETEDEVSEGYVSADDGQGYGRFHISTFQDAYVPRPSKRKGHGREASKGVGEAPMSEIVSKGKRFRSARPTVQPKRKPTKKPSRQNYSDSDESEDEAPKKRRKSGGRQSPRKGRRKSYKEEEDVSEDEDSEDEAPARGRAAKAKPAQSRSRSRKLESSAEEDEDSEQEPPPKKKPAPAKKTPAKKTPAKKGKSPAQKPVSKRKLVSSDEPNSSEDVDSEEEAPPAKQRRGTPAKKATPAKSSAAADAKGRGSPRRATARNYRADSSDEDEEVMPPPTGRRAPTDRSQATPTPKSKAKKGKGRRK